MKNTVCIYGQAMADTLNVYWCPSLLLTLATQILGILWPFWYRVTWDQEGIIRTQHAGLFSAFNDADYIVLCGGMDVCQDVDPNSSISYNYDIAKTLLMAGSVFLSLGFVVSVPGCWKTVGGNYLMLARICGYAACLTLVGCLWIYVTFYYNTISYQMSFVTLQVGHSFYLTMFSGCVTSVLACALYTIATIKGTSVTQAKIHDDVIQKNCSMTGKVSLK
ncbi:uncharacterized protein LOC117324042 [Pecten maximus]|uniref:uncharacterized protein LOC117324042 n=1 Tax=Pecten maximus TaxID=6579 RepID=UPI0014585A95|nr:uncharacterized protein LOC117324042 [Pecten maximus]